jgi:tRNA (guanine37-N1)-methyltransferase
VLHLSPRGRPLTHARVTELAALSSVTLLASRYEAVDQRFIDLHVDEEIAVGDFVVSGGELPAMMLMDAVVRLLPGALNDARSAQEDSFANGLLDCPHYTRPELFQGLPVPEVLLSGHHARIARWRREQALAITRARRPELLASLRSAGGLDAADERFLAALEADAQARDLG